MKEYYRITSNFKIYGEIEQIISNKTEKYDISLPYASVDFIQKTFYVYITKIKNEKRKGMITLSFVNFDDNIKNPKYVTLDEMRMW